LAQLDAILEEHLDGGSCLPTGSALLISSVAGTAGVGKTAARLIDQCAWLPLALRIAAELAVAHEHTPLAALVADLAGQQRRLDVLDAGDSAELRSVFSWSLRHLPAEAADTFGLVGLHPGPDFDVHAAAVLAGTDVHRTRRTLTLLARAHLIHPTSWGRYGMHDLLRDYAREVVDQNAGAPLGPGTNSGVLRPHGGCRDPPPVSR
jgi:hypothetical protein